MENKLNETISILEKLVSFPTISGTSTREINKFIEEYLSQHGLEPVLSYDEDGERSNIFVTIGPKIDGGVLFNGHTVGSLIRPFICICEWKRTILWLSPVRSAWGSSWRRGDVAHSGLAPVIPRTTRHETTPCERC